MNVFTAALAMFFASLVASCAMAHPIHGAKLPILNIEESAIAVPLVRQQSEEAIFAVNSSQSGFGRTTQTGLTVQRGTSGTLSFSINVFAVESETLANLDQEFESSLSVSEREEYESFRSDYKRGLNIPFLRWVGVNLGNSRVTREEMERSFELRENYNTQSSIAQQILENVQVQNIQVSGSLTAFGTSFIPTTVFAFIRIARVTLQDGSTLTVVSQNGNDLVAADAGGNTVPSSGGTINTIPLL